jgi:hypothetical protein
MAKKNRNKSKNNKGAGRSVSPVNQRAKEQKEDKKQTTTTSEVVKDDEEPKQVEQSEEQGVEAGDKRNDASTADADKSDKSTVDSETAAAAAAAAPETSNEASADNVDKDGGEEDASGDRVEIVSASLAEKLSRRPSVEFLKEQGLVFGRELAGEAPDITRRKHELEKKASSAKY